MQSSSREVRRALRVRERFTGSAQKESEKNMAAMAGLINQSLTAGNSLTAGQALTGKSASPLATASSGTSSSASSGSSSSTISANDFLTLLVTEMQNQDPTADTDPNEYIDQLVQVNSLEQLIDINQNLSTALGIPATSSSDSGTDSSEATSAKSSLTGSNAAGSSAPGSAAPGAAAAVHHASAQQSAHRASVHSTAPAASTAPGANTAAAISQFAQSRFAQSAGAKHAPGNLSVPAADPAAHRVGHALDGHAHASTIPGRLPAGE
jgi:flagellar basal-body rod modification protein FlgD